MLALEPRIVFDGAGAVSDPDLVTVDNLSHVTLADASATDPLPPAAIEISPSIAVSTDARHELVVIDGGLNNLQTLIDDVQKSDPSRSVLVLDPTGNEVDQLTQYLQAHAASLMPYI